MKSAGTISNGGATFKPFAVNGRNDHFIVASLIVICSIFLLSQIGEFPILLWDESRQAVNALEMAERGFSPVTSYNGVADLWNTKPPLMIWLQAAAIRILGPTELAVRLPSAISGIGTIAIVIIFTRRFSNDVRTPCLAALLLLLSPLFFGQHGAATGDYDALLTFFSTAYLTLFFDALRTPSPKRWRVWVAAVAVFAAMMTKGIAGIMPGVGVAVHLIITKRLTRAFAVVDYLVAAFAVIGAFAAFLVWRENSAPGYLAAIWSNEIAGRYFNSFEQHRHSVLYYFWHGLFLFDFSLGFVALLAFAGPFVTVGKQRMGVIYCLIVASAFVVVISLSVTKLTWYALPVYPFVAIALALAIDGGLKYLADARWKATLFLATAMFLAMGRAVYIGHFALGEASHGFVQNYGRLFEMLRGRANTTVHVVDAGVLNTAGIEVYTPMLRFYSLAFAQRGMQIRHHSSLAETPTIKGTVIASCDQNPSNVAMIANAGQPIPRAPAGCAAAILADWPN